MIESATALLSQANQLVIFGPFVAGAIVALLARRTDPRVSWLVFTGCLLPLLGIFGGRVFYATYSPSDHGSDAADLAYATLGIGQGLLSIASGALFVLAIATVLRVSRR